MHCKYYHHQRDYQYSLLLLVELLMFSVNFRFFPIAGLFVSLEVRQRGFAYDIASTQICFFRENIFCDWLLPSKVSQPLRGLVCRSARKHSSCFFSTFITYWHSSCFWFFINYFFFLQISQPLRRLWTGPIIQSCYFNTSLLCICISVCFYRTRVRSLSCLVSNSLTDSLPFCKLDWCDPGV